MLVLVNLMHKKHEKVDHNSMGVKHALHDQDENCIKTGATQGEAEQ